jgi:phosphate-selective porin OprO/OprP
MMSSVSLAAQTTTSPDEPPSAPASGQGSADNGADDDPPVRFLFRERPSLRFGSVLRIDFRLKLQGDFRAFSPNVETEEGLFEMHRRRVGIQGTFLRHFEYEVERELREKRVWRDAFVNFGYFDNFQIQAGKFKIPFSLEQLTTPTDLNFVYRAKVVDNLSPARDIGVTMHGRFGRRALGYDVGVFRNDGENARFDFNPGAGRTVAARVTARPLRLASAPPATQEMEVAFAVTAGVVPEGFNSLRGRTAFRQPFFQPVYVKGRRVRMGIDADWRPGPISLKAEFIRVSDERKNQGLFDEDLPPLIARGWYVSGTWALTGEPKLEGIEPRRPLFAGGFGAIELAARYERLTFGSFFEGEPELTNPRAANLLETGDRGWTFGVTWYINHWAKIQVNAIREWIADTDRSPIPDRALFWTRVCRLQFVL